MDLDLALTRSGGIIECGSNTIRHSYTTTNTGGTLNRGTSTWIYDQSDDRSHNLSAVNDTLYNMVINSSDNENKDYFLTGTITIENKLSLTNAGIGTGTVQVLDTFEVVSVGEQTDNAGIRFVGDENGVFYRNGDDIDNYDIVIAKSGNAEVDFVSSGATFTSGSDNNNLVVESGIADFSPESSVNVEFEEIQLDGGTLRATSGTFTWDGDWDNNGGKFEHNNGRFQYEYENRTWESTVADTFNVLILAGTGGGKEIAAEADDEIIILDTLYMTQGEGFFNATFKPAGNLIMASGWAANGSQGTMEFVGNNAQILDFSAGVSDFDGDIVLNKTGGSSVTLASELDLNGSGQSITFTAGYLVTTNTNILDFPDNNATTSGGSNSSFVDGPIRKRNTSSFFYPVGNAGVYGPITVDPVSGTGTEFEVEYTFSTPTDNTDLGTGVQGISQKEYWTVTRTNSSNSANITLHWDITRSGNITDYTKLLVAHYTGGTWQNEGNSNITGDNNSGTVTANGVSSFSPFTLGTSDVTVNALPVELTEFKATPDPEENVVHLFWVTSSELNNDYFTVERTKDLKEFEEVAQVTGQGTTNQRTEYHETDYNPYEGVSYYRLSQTDFDGKREYFDLKKVLLELDGSTKDIDVQLYPNPNNGHNMYMKIPNSDEEEMNVLVNDFLGKEFLIDFTVINQGSYSVVAIEMNQKLPAGSYLISVAVGDKTHQHRLIVQ